MASQYGFSGYATELGIYVRPRDLEAAEAIADRFETTRLPHLSEAEAEPDPSACPACGEPLDELAASCRSCGLELPEAEG